MRIALSLLCVAAALPAGAQSGRRETGGLVGFSQMVESLVKRVDPAVVQILTTGFAVSEGEGPVVRLSRGSGSGVVVDAEGYILTNAHVIRNARTVQVLLPEPAEESARYQSVVKPSGKRYAARVLGMDRQTDIAVLKIDAKVPAFIPFGDSEALRQGQIVLAFGSPFGLENSVTMGVVSSVARQIRPDDPMIYIQTDAAINPGNSGGPLVDPQGRLVGINTFIISPSGANDGIGFAVPSNIARTIYEQIKKTGTVRRGQIGVIAQSISPEMAQALGLPRDWGVVIADVTPNSAAQAAGLEVGDVVLTFNGKTMENARQFGVNIYSAAGTTAEVEIQRGAETLKKRVAVQERPRDPERILSLVSGDDHLVARLGILAVDLDEKVTPLLPPLRRYKGAVVAAAVSEIAAADPLRPGDVIYSVNKQRIGSLRELRGEVDKLPKGAPVALHIERQGQLQYLVIELE